MPVPLGTRAVALVLAVLCVPPAHASQVEEAERRFVTATELFARNEYEQALEQVRRARTLTDLEGDELKASLALWEGLLLLHLGRKDEFKTHLEVAFLLQPDLALPGRMSPKIKQRVEEVRASVKKKFERPAIPLRPEPRVEPKVEPPPRTEPNPAALPVTGRKQEMPTPAIPSAELARSAPAPVVPLVLGGVALGAGAAGAWFGLQSQDGVARARSEREQIAAHDTLVTAQDQALVANIAFAVAGTAALAAVVTLLVNR